MYTFGRIYLDSKFVIEESYKRKILILLILLVLPLTNNSK